MSELTPARHWTMRIGFAMLVLIILFFHLLPLQTAAGGLIWPDFILVLALAWSVRRPDYVPPVLLAGCFLLADLLLQRPPGPWAVLALIACEQMKKQSGSLRDAGFTSELLSATMWIVAVGFGYRLVLALTLVETPALVPALIQIVITAMAYPLVAAFTHGVMGVRKTTPNEVGGSGLRT